MTDLSKIAAAVQQRAAALAVAEADQPLDPAVVKEMLDANERGDGILYAWKHRGKFLYKRAPDGSGEWLVWRGNVWEPDRFEESFGAVEACALVYDEQALRVRDEMAQIQQDTGKQIAPRGPDGWRIKLKENYVTRAKRLRSSNGADKVLRWAPIVDKMMAVREEDLDQKPMLLPVKNGVIDLATGVLISGRPDDLLSRCLDIDYDPHADYEPVQKFVREICGNDELAAFLKRSFGYGITGRAHEQFIWVFTGPGRNGKGVLFSLIGEVMGPYYRELSRGMLVEQKVDPPPNAASEHLYSLLGKRIVVGAETNRGQRIDAAAVKQLTGEDQVICRPNFRSEISFSPTHTLFLHTNHIPAGLTSDFAMIQRLLKVEFPYMYVDDPATEAKKYPLQSSQFRQKDPGLKQHLRKYKQGWLRWLVEGCLEWQRDGISPPLQVQEWVDELAKQEDYIREFILDCLVDDSTAGARIQVSTMYDHFRWWWSVNRDENLKHLPQMKTMTAEMRNRGYQVDKVGGRYWIYGIAIDTDVAIEAQQYVEKLKIKRG